MGFNAIYFLFIFGVLSNVVQLLWGYPFALAFIGCYWLFFLIFLGGDGFDS